MEAQFWAIVDSYTQNRWWFGLPALLSVTATALMILVAAVRLGERTRVGRLLAIIGLSCTLALLMPGLLLTLRPFETLGIDRASLATLPTATFVEVAAVFDQSVQLAYLGTAMLMFGALGALGAIGMRRGDPCPTCGRERHPCWHGACPECQLMRPELAAVAPDNLARTALLDGAAGESTAWVELVDAAGGAGERFVVADRLTIGRDPQQCQVVIDDETVSARHAYIELEPDGHTLYDWSSRNGVSLNGVAVRRARLADGDAIGVGRALLRFHAAPERDRAPTVILGEAPAGASLVQCGGLAAGRRYPLTQLDTRIGRSRDNELVLDDPALSRHHASICYDGDGFVLVDAQSPNGSWLDGRRVIGQAPLRHGQLIRLATQELRFEWEENNDA